MSDQADGLRRWMKNRAATIARDSKGTPNAPHEPTRARTGARPNSSMVESLRETSAVLGVDFSADDRDQDHLFEESAAM